MAALRVALLMLALLLVSIASVTSASDGAASKLVSLPQVAGPQAKRVTRPNDLATGAPLCVFLQTEIQMRCSLITVPLCPGDIGTTFLSLCGVLGGG